MSKSRPRIVFLSDFPGNAQLPGGGSFSGPDGKLFASIMRTAGLDLSDYRFSYAFPKGSDEDNFKNPDFTEHINHEREKMANYIPDVIVPLGKYALWTLIGSTAIDSFRGAAQMDNAKLFKLLPTYHPRDIRKQWKFYPIAVGDILKAYKEAERGPKIVYPKRELLLEPTLNDIHKFFDVCRQRSDEYPLSPLSVDIETGWGQITCIGFAPTTESAICIPFLDIRNPNKSYWSSTTNEVEAWWMIREILEDPSIRKLGQNFAAYDAFWLLDKVGIRVMNLREDTRLLHHAIYPELPKDLAFMGATYTQQGPWKTWGYRAKRDD